MGREKVVRCSCPAVWWHLPFSFLCGVCHFTLSFGQMTDLWFSQIGWASSRMKTQVGEGSPLLNLPVYLFPSPPLSLCVSES